MGSEQRPGRDREILAARLALPTGRAVLAAAIVGIEAAAMRTDRRAVGIGPAQPAKRGLGFLCGHREDLSEAQGLGRFCEEEVLCHCRIRYCDSEYDNLPPSCQRSSCRIC